MSLLRSRHFAPLAGLFAILLVTASQARGEEISDALFYGDDERLVRNLSQVLSSHWHRVPLREVLLGIERTQPISIALDRRTDPHLLVSLDVQEMPLGELLEKLATRAGLGVAASRGLVYLGPPEAASELRTLWAIAHQQVAGMSPALRAKMRRRDSLRFQRLSEPRDAIAQLGRQMNVSIKNLEKIPFDLRPATELPEMEAIEQLTLLLLGFDLFWTPSRDRRGIRLVPIERPVVVERMHPRRAEKEMPKVAFRQLYPGVTARVEGKRKRLLVTGILAQHEWLRGDERPSVARPSQRGHRGKQVYSLRVDAQPAGALLKQLSLQLKMPLVLEKDAEAIPAALRRRISIEVREASLQELLEAIGRELELEVKVAGGSIEVAKRKSPASSD